MLSIYSDLGENLDLGDRAIMAIAIFMPTNPQIANFPLLNKQYFK
ncbi:hypothetical protein Q5691_04665 [Microcoleus sp. w1-18aA5]